MKALAAAALLASLFIPRLEPTYTVTSGTGDHAFLFSLRSNSKPVMSSTPDNTLSTWQPLPFAWKYFGETVRGYKVSDNGYLTFDSTATASVAAHTELPDAAAPRGSIFGYWTDINMSGTSGPWTNTVISATLGEAPNRVHVIYWMSVVPKLAQPAASTISFIVAIYENGEFETIYTTTMKGGKTAGTVGAVSLDGKRAVMASGPAFDFPAVGFGGEDDFAFRFKPVEK